MRYTRPTCPAPLRACPCRRILRKQFFRDIQHVQDQQYPEHQQHAAQHTFSSNAVDTTFAPARQLPKPKIPHVIGHLTSRRGTPCKSHATWVSAELVPRPSRDMVKG